MGENTTVEQDRFYIDCEFDGHNGPLLSIAIVGEDGRSIHIEADVKASDPWVVANVVPLMDQHDAADCTRVRPNDVGGMIRWFLGDCNPTIIADSPVDIGRFCQALSTADDGAWASVNYPLMTFEVHNIDCYPTDLPGAVQHNAWWDAMALRAALRSTPQPEADSKLLMHFTRMQDAAANYVEPTTYVARRPVDKGVGLCKWNTEFPMPEPTHAPEAVASITTRRDQAFINDMIYMLDGPEQREAQAKPLDLPAQDEVERPKGAGWSTPPETEADHDERLTKAELKALGLGVSEWAYNHLSKGYAVSLTVREVKRLLATAAIAALDPHRAGDDALREENARLRGALRDASVSLWWAARQMKGNCNGGAVDAVNLAAENASSPASLTGRQG